MNRRDIIKLGALGVAAVATNSVAKENSDNKSSVTPITHPLGKRARVAIIGGGYAGLSVAKSIREYNSEAQIVIFESKNIFASCPYSNLWIGGVEGVGYDELLFSTLEPANIYGYEVINEKVTNIDTKAKTLTTLGGVYEYTLLVLATGIEYDYAPLGLDAAEAKLCRTLYPASYTGGEEQLSLKKKVENFKEGIFAITVPKGAYRCPPAPYERAALIASYFKSKGLKAKVVLLDPREKPTTKSKGFLKAFTQYEGYLEYLPMSNITGIDLQKKSISYDGFDVGSKKFVPKTLEFEDANIIPANKASSLLTKAGLEVTSTGWGRVAAPGFQSVSDPDVYLVGDVVGEYPFPKSAQMANSCGLIVGSQIGRRLSGLDPQVGQEMPVNVCYSMVSPTTAIAVEHQAYRADGTLKVKAEFFEEADNQIAVATKNWYRGITASIFS